MRSIKNVTAFLLFVLVCSTGMTLAQAEKTGKKNKLHHSADEEAMFPGGNAAFTAFANESIVYPITALNDKLTGKAVVELIIEKDGIISSLRIKKGIRSDVDEEIIRVLKTMPPWIPGKNKGEPVRMRKLQPISFKIH